MTHRALALLFVLAAQCFAAPAPPLPDAAEDVQPGLLLTFTPTQGAADARPARLVALRVPAGTPATPFLAPGPVTATWEGFLNQKLRDEYQFVAEGRGGRVQLRVNDALVLDAAGEDLSKTVSPVVKLQKGRNRIVVRYDAPPMGDAFVRLCWFNAEFVREPVLPEVFTHNAAAPAARAAARLRDGRGLVADLRCLKCHAAPADLAAAKDAMPELADDTPDLAEIGARLRPDWLAHWIDNPRALRPDTVMPRVFGTKLADAQAPSPQAADVAAYLATLGPPNKSTDPAPADESLAAGGRLFTNLGCVACHTLPKPEGAAAPDDRVSLRYVKAKFQPGMLKAFLLNPQQHHAAIRMPNFRLTDAEAAHLATFLLARTSDLPPAPKGDPAKGKALVQSAGCLNCHPMKLDNTFKSPALADVLKPGLTSGCLADPADAKSRGRAPEYALAGPQRAALRAFAATDLASLKRDVAPEVARRQMKALNCLACHPHDAQGDRWTALAAEVQAIESTLPEGDKPEVAGVGELTPEQTRPPLTWLGEKLKPEWARRFIAGQVAYKPRPWTYARMPAFAHRAGVLAEGFALEHGVPTASPPDPAADPKLAEAGKKLAGRDGGLSCISCHAIAALKPIGTFESQAINFKLVKDRVRHDFYARWVMDPGRVEPGTKMPKFADLDFKVLSAPADEQFNAIWHYLLTGDKIVPPE